MSKVVYLIPGYGVPKNILVDANMGVYLRRVANYIFDQTQKNGDHPTVIFSGGPTDMWKPYRRTEAGEMWRWMKKSIPSTFFQKSLASWDVRIENRSLSTLENILFSRKFISARSSLTVFSEFTRVSRWKALLRATKMRNAKVHSVDFDTSDNRYLLAHVEEKERKMRTFDLWALQSKRNLEQHHAFFLKRVEYLRTAGPSKHVTAIQQFWKDGITFLPPDIQQLFL